MILSILFLAPPFLRPGHRRARDHFRWRVPVPRLDGSLHHDVRPKRLRGLPGPPDRADAVVASWNATAERLMPVLQSRGKVGKQHQTEGDSQQNYWDTVVALTSRSGRCRNTPRLSPNIPA